MKKAFTLIELLVVIAIIAILAAILFPVFAQAKMAAKKTQSLSNVKNIALGIVMYADDADDTLPQSEYWGGNTGRPVYYWTAAVYPYIKSGKQKQLGGETVNYGTDGIFKSPGYPKTESNAANFEQQGGGSYGVNNGMFARNYENNGAAQANTSYTMTAIDGVADKVMILEKGANATNSYFYPWFHEWQKYWIWDIFPTDGDPTNPTRDGVDVYTVGRPGYDARYDTDCTAATDGAWECAAHPRYRFSGTAPMAFADGHAKAIKKGGIKWFQNIFVDRRGLSNNFSWYYGYVGGGWDKRYVC